MRSLIYNLVALARPMLMLKGAHMTFHLGEDRPWRTPENRDYLKFNVNCALSIVRRIISDPEMKSLLEAFIIAHGEKRIRIK